MKDTISTGLLTVDGHSLVGRHRLRVATNLRLASVRAGKDAPLTTRAAALPTKSIP